LESQIAALRGGGQPLDASTRRFFEQRFGRDFSDVRIHEQSAAADTARAVNARAYTTGREIVFASSQYSPETNPGRRLIAHELAHVVQQRGGRITGQNSAIQRACPKAPTHLGDNAPDADQDCEEAHVSVGGQMFFFCVDSDVLTDESEARLSALAPALHQLPVVEVHGYASPEGPAGREDVYNLNLSCFRARRVASILTGKGVLSTRLQIFKHGGTSEFGKNDKNRVVVIPNVVPVSPGPLHNKFRVAALSFLACAPCNPFTDDGAVTTSPLSPPTSEPASGSSFRMKHWIEVEAISDDSIHIKSSRILNSGQEPGKSGYCGKVDPATAVFKSGPVGPKAGVDPIHGESVEWESEFVTRVNANVPATLPDAPCGPLGTNPMIPPIRNRFRMRIFADGTRESEFLSASTFPFQHLYEDGSVKIFAGQPVHPAIDFDACATSTGVSATEAEVGFKALREACCKGLTLPGCATVCKGNKSEVVTGFGVNTGDLTMACLSVGALLFAQSCPSPCGPAGTVCPIPTLPSNP
jgi:outer membrane protein OmpA-like peptidoglycan-associated protein